MDSEFILTLAKKSFSTALMLGGPMLTAGLAAGITMSIFQTVTSIREQTLIFIPKMVAVMATIVVCAPWMLEILTSFTREIFLNIAEYVK